MAELTLVKIPAKRVLGILKVDDGYVFRLLEKEDEMSGPVILKETKAPGFIEAKKILDRIFVELVEDDWLPDPDSFR